MVHTYYLVILTGRWKQEDRELIASLRPSCNTWDPVSKQKQDGSLDKAFATQVWGSESRFQHPHKSQVGMESCLQSQHWGRQGQGVPGASWLALANYEFWAQHETLLQYIQWRMIEEDTWCQPREPASTCMDTHVCAPSPIYVNTHTYMLITHNIYMQKSSKKWKANKTKLKPLKVRKRGKEWVKVEIKLNQSQIFISK